jgi:hypothetical protein
MSEYTVLSETLDPAGSVLQIIETKEPDQSRVVSMKVEFLSIKVSVEALDNSQ